MAGREDVSVAPSPRHVLGAEQQIPGLIAEPFRLGGETGWRLGASFECRRHQGSGSGRRGTGRQLNQLDLVAIGIFHEGDHRAAVLHRAWFANNPTPLASNACTGRLDVIHAQSDVSITTSEVVLGRIPVVREL